MTEKTYHRGAVVRSAITFKGVPVVFDIVDPWMLMPKRKGWQLEAATREARNCACTSALAQYGRSSYRNRQAKKKPITRYGVKR